MIKILCLSGPNLQLLGTREPHIYGYATLDDVHGQLREEAVRLGASVTCQQSNHEGALCDAIGSARGSYAGILINAGALTHTSWVLYDALRAVALPAVEVHLSNPEARETFRHESRIAGACLGKVAGFGAASYVIALRALVEHLRARPAPGPDGTSRDKGSAAPRRGRRAGHEAATRTRKRTW